MKHKLYFIILLLFPYISQAAENASNIRVAQQNSAIVITYDLKKKSNVRLLVSANGERFREVKATEGAVGKQVQAGKDLTITWYPLRESETFIANDVRFKVEALSMYDAYAAYNSPDNNHRRTFLLGQYAYSPTPQHSYGLVFGQTYTEIGVGWFVDMRSNWNFTHFTGKQDGENYPVTDRKDGGIYTWINDGVPQDPAYPLYSGKTEQTMFVAHVGFAFTFPIYYKCNTIGAYCGLGYGLRRMALETMDGKWVEYTPTTYNGFSANLGIMGSVYGLTLRGGINTISFKYVELEAAIGWMF